MNTIQATEPTSKMMLYLKQNPTSSSFASHYHGITKIMKSYQLKDMIEQYNEFEGTCSGFTCVLIAALQALSGHPNKATIINHFLDELVIVLYDEHDEITELPFTSTMDWLMSFFNTGRHYDDHLAISHTVEHLVGTDEFTFKNAQFYILQKLSDDDFHNEYLQVISIAFYALALAIKKGNLKMDPSSPQLMSMCMKHFNIILEKDRKDEYEYSLYDYPDMAIYEFQY